MTRVIFLKENVTFDLFVTLRSLTSRTPSPSASVSMNKQGK